MLESILFCFKIKYSFSKLLNSFKHHILETKLQYLQMDSSAVRIILKLNICIFKIKKKQKQVCLVTKPKLWTVSDYSLHHKLIFIKQIFLLCLILDYNSFSRSVLVIMLPLIPIFQYYYCCVYANQYVVVESLVIIMSWFQFF